MRKVGSRIAITLTLVAMTWTVSSQQVKRPIGSDAARIQHAPAATTLAAALGGQMPPTTTGHVLPVLRSGFARPRVVMLLVLDGMRRDYFDRYGASMPTLTALRQRSAWFTQAQVNFLPTNTAVGHSTLPTGADPRVHGITRVSVYDHTQPMRHDSFAGGTPQDLMAFTLAGVWPLETVGQVVVLA